jgi:hypothetical protein
MNVTPGRGTALDGCLGAGEHADAVGGGEQFGVGQSCIVVAMQPATASTYD